MTAVVASAATLSLQPTTASAAESGSVLNNGTFTAGAAGWKATNDNTRFAVTDTSWHDAAAELTARSNGVVALGDSQSDHRAAKGSAFTASVFVRTTRPGVRARLVVRERKSGATTLRTVQDRTLENYRWQEIRVPVTVERSDAALDLRVRATGVRGGQSILVDDVRLFRRDGGTAPASTSARTSGTTTSGAATRGGRTLSNGCSLSARGIPSCGALVGGAYGANDDPADWERSLGGHLGLHRLFYSSGQIKGAVRDVKADLAKGRLPWVSFKAPHSWSAMANGRGDAWVKDLARSMRDVGGPVWLAIEHEPENGGDILQWKRMQERIAPIVRNNAPNVAYSVILMGYHEFFGADKFAMSRIWPNTKVDIAGFDVYDHYGKNGQKKHTDMGAYFDKIQTWSQRSGVPWGLAETGISHAGAADYPGWFKDTYTKLVNKGGKGLAYFNTNLHSFQDWRLNTSLKRDRFRAMFRTSPTL